MRQNWTYNPETQKLSDGQWEINASPISGSTTDLKLSSMATMAADTTEIDLSKPVDGAFKIVQIAASTAIFRARAVTVFSKIILPSTLQTADSYAFYQTKGEIHLPEENEVTKIGTSAFTIPA